MYWLIIIIIIIIILEEIEASFGYRIKCKE